MLLQISLVELVGNQFQSSKLVNPQDLQDRISSITASTNTPFHSSGTTPGPGAAVPGFGIG